MDNHTLLLIFVALTAVSVMLQVAVLIALFAGVRKVSAKAEETMNDFRATVLPAVHSTRDLLERISPQVISISTDVADLAAVLRKETNHVKSTATEIAGRVNRQTQRLDEMLTRGLNSVERVAAVLEGAVAAPVRQANGIFAAVRAVVDTYRTTVPHRTEAPRRRSAGSNGNSEFEI